MSRDDRDEMFDQGISKCKVTGLLMLRMGGSAWSSYITS
jgi:hypothetical protein